jgi:hypothetical protein
MHIKDNLPKDILILSYLFNKEGYEFNCVGGCVRDSLLGLIPKDWDVCTNAQPNDIIKILKDNDIEYQEMGVHFGIVVAKMEEDIEIATYRTDGINRTAVVEFGCTIEEDSNRRDFTINALYYNVNDDIILDFHNGQEDLKNKLIKTVGNPEDRFLEDELRKLRCIRFSSRFHFLIETNTFNVIKNNPSLKGISKERIINEFLMAYDKAEDKYYFVLLIKYTNLYTTIFTDICVDFTNCINMPILCNNIHLLLASILYVNTIDILKYLMNLGFDTRLSKSVDFLIRFKVNSYKEDFNPNDYCKLRSGCDVSDNDILIYTKADEYSIAFLEFKPDTEKSLELMSKGIVGKELGLALNDYYILSYKTILNRIKSEQTTQKS